MPENTPDRLQSFREEYAEQGPQGSSLGKAQFAAIVVLLLAILGAVLATRLSDSPQAEAAPTVGRSTEKDRELAIYLAEKGQPREAIAAYERYLATAMMTDDQRARVCLGAANVAIDLEDYDAALGYLYESELLAADDALKKTVNRSVVMCLEKLGRAESLRRELRSRSGISAPAAGNPGAADVLADLGNEVITKRDLERELDALPAGVRGTIDSPEKQMDFLRNMVAERMLVDQARHLELDKDPEVLARMARELEGLMVRKLIEDEIRAKMAITPEEVRRFYTAEIHRFSRPASATGRMVSASTEEEANVDSEGAKRVRILAGRVDGLQLSPELAARIAKDILALESGAQEYVVNIEGEWYAFKGEVQGEVVQPFEEIQPQVEQFYRKQKEQEHLAALVDSALKSRGVKIYAERLVEEDQN